MNVSRRKMVKLNVMAASALWLQRPSVLTVSKTQTSVAPGGTREQQWLWLPGGAFQRHERHAQSRINSPCLLTVARPKQGSLLHQHTREDELFHVVSGFFEIQVGDQCFTGGPGLRVAAPRGVPHRWTNVGLRKGQLLSTYSPLGLEKLFASLALPIQSSGEIPEVDYGVFGPRILHHVLNAGVTRVGSTKFPAYS